MQTQDMLKVSRRKFHKTNMRIPRKVHEGNGAKQRGEGRGRRRITLAIPFTHQIYKNNPCYL